MRPHTKKNIITDLILGCTPHHIILYHSISYHSLPYYNIPYYTISYHTIPSLRPDRQPGYVTPVLSDGQTHHTIPYHTIPYHTIPYHNVADIHHHNSVWQLDIVNILFITFKLIFALKFMNTKIRTNLKFFAFS